MPTQTELLIYASTRFRVDKNSVTRLDGVRMGIRVSKNGYPYFRLHHRRQNMIGWVFLHRFVAYAKFGEAIFQPKIQVRHLDCNKLNFHPDNLDIGTALQNFNDNTPAMLVKHKRAGAKGSNSLRKFSKAEILSIRKSRINGMAYKDICVKYGCCKSTVSEIINRKLYKEI